MARDMPSVRIAIIPNKLPPQLLTNRLSCLHTKNRKSKACTIAEGSNAFSKETNVASSLDRFLNFASQGKPPCESVWHRDNDAHVIVEDPAVNASNSRCLHFCRRSRVMEWMTHIYIYI